MIASNCDAARTEFDLLERGLVPGFAVTLWLNEGHIVEQRCDKPLDISMAETICINLLHAAWSSLVNATRLSLYGAHVDSLGLVRAALEAAYHAEYFCDHPEDALAWDEAGKVEDLEQRRTLIRKCDSDKRVRSKVEAKYAPDKSLSRFFYELSTYGAHANPATVSLRLSSGTPGVANLGFISVGKLEATQLCANHILHTLSYVISTYRDGFSDYLNENHQLVARVEEFEAILAKLRASGPSALSLSK